MSVGNIRMARTTRLALRLLRVAAVEQRLPVLLKKYPGIREGVIRDLATVDPTGDKGSYLDWLVNRVSKGNIRWDEDRDRVKKALEMYHNIKRSPRLLKEYGVSPDINKYTLHDLGDITDKINGVELKTERQTQEESKQSGTKVIYDKSPYKIIKIGGSDVDLEQASKAACLYAKGTKWCISDPEVNKKYLSDGPLFIIFENGYKIAQTDGEQLMDIRDREISLEDNMDLWKLLVDIGIISKRSFGYSLAEILGKRVPEYEPYIMKDPKYAYPYAASILKHRWPEAEPYIIKDPRSAYNYALNVLKHRWPEAEPYIMKDPGAAYLYAKYILKERWPEAEPYIMKDSLDAYLYAVHILKHRWPEAEPYIMKGTEYAYFYALQVLKKRWPEAEPYIMKDPVTWKSYKERFLS